MMAAVGAIAIIATEEKNVERRTSNAQPPSQKDPGRRMTVDHATNSAGNAVSTRVIGARKIDIIAEIGRRSRRSRCRQLR